ncbi:hyaluronidase-like [Microcaecilia unicolor]|uniref:Hyaluronidase n=1 Tax=Microcaecilia unicolor TaxID=1415580 RepID=A0A6P7YHN3_9AMPH|nr:hyaluronidase-like [Microcaecilia unicolor]
MKHQRESDPNAQSPTSETRNGNEEKPMRVNELSSRTCYQQPCHLFLSFVLLLGNGLMNRCYGLKPSLPSILPNQPFVVFWNAPTARCQNAYGVPLSLNAFSIVHNKLENFIGGNITIFYYDQLGRYPYYMNSTAINGGCPQNSSLQSHLDQMVVDIKKAMPQSFMGLAVIDWEEWRPQWVRNWNKKNIYRSMSQKLVRNKNPNWTTDQVVKQAQWEFETAAQKFMSRTIEDARFQQPAGQWGYYLYPECYNYDYQINFANFTGHCPDIEVQRNNQLQWLWEVSKALYPSIYMEEVLKSSNQGNKFVKAKVIEAMRVAELPSSVCSLPVYVYSRPFYSYSLKPLTQVDLIYTIGQTAALGAQGVVLWGDVDYSRNKSNCQIVQKYLKTTLGPYIINVTMAAKLCSEFICNNNGRCLRKNSDLDTYLHLNSDSFIIRVEESGGQSYVSVKGSMSQNQKETMKEEFICHCYRGWTGKNCQAGAECQNSSKGLRLTWQWDWCVLIAISCGLLFLGHL